MTTLSDPYRGFEIAQVTKTLPIFTTIPRDSHRINEDLFPLIEQYRNEHSESLTTNVVCNWRSDWYVQKDERFNWFNEWILGHVDFLAKYHLGQEINFSIANEWLMMYDVGDYAKLHDHFPYCLSVIYYVGCEENAAPVVFERQLEISPEAGKLIIFPSSLQHEVDKTEGRRVAVSMNLNQY